MDPLALILLGISIFMVMMLTLVYPKTGTAILLACATLVWLIIKFAGP